MKSLLALILQKCSVWVLGYPLDMSFINALPFLCYFWLTGGCGSTWLQRSRLETLTQPRSTNTSLKRDSAVRRSSEQLPTPPGNPCTSSKRWDILVEFGNTHNPVWEPNLESSKDYSNTVAVPSVFFFFSPYTYLGRQSDNESEKPCQESRQVQEPCNFSFMSL